MEFDLSDATLHYDIHGEGQPLLWLHGFLGCGADWRYLFDDPPAGYSLIAPDLRGHGASTNPPGSFSFRQAAGDVLALLRHLGVGPVKAIGLSGGGIVLLHMAVLDHSSLSSMVVVSAPPYFPEQARAVQRQFSDAVVGATEMERMRRRHARGERQVQALLAHARAFADSYEDVNFTPPLLSTIPAPTLIVFGDHDPFYPVSLAFELRASIPNSYLWVVPNGGHGPVFGDAAAQFRATALAFLAGAWTR